MSVDLRDLRTQLLIIVSVLLVVDMVAIAVLISPVGRGRTKREQTYEQLRLEKIEKTKAVAPAEGMEQKIAAAREQETAFNRDRLAVRYSAMSDQLSHIASDAGVSVSDVKYDERTAKETPAGYDGIGITIQIHGSYEQDMRFINEVERQKVLLIIDGVTFSGMQGDQLTVSVHLSTYLRSAA